MKIAVEQISQLPDLEIDSEEHSDFGRFWKLKLLLQGLVALPRLIALIPIFLYHIARGIFWIHKNRANLFRETDLQEERLDVSYDHTFVSIQDQDNDRGYVHFRLNRDAFVLFCDNLKKVLKLENNPESHFENTNWHIHSDFILPELPLQITFYPGKDKIRVDQGYNLFGNPQYFRLMIKEFEEVISEDQNCAIVLDASDSEKISPESRGRIIFEYKKD